MQTQAQHKPDWDVWLLEPLIRLTHAVALSLDVEPIPNEATRNSDRHGFFRYHDMEANSPYMLRLNETAMWVVEGRLTPSTGQGNISISDAPSSFVSIKSFVRLCIEERLTIPTQLAAIVAGNPEPKAKRKSRTQDRDKALMKRAAELAAAGHSSIDKQLAKEFDLTPKTVANIKSNNRIK